MADLLLAKKIAEFYRIDTELKELSAADRIAQRQTRIKPLVEDFFAWQNNRLQGARYLRNPRPDMD